ncbi:MAG: M18 family aminopeptidase, partial [Pseudomonadota bacterium]|nr:M18 family aminopeptidase [Pseudomonadota bacterium]
IHLDREANQKRSINAQTDLPALFAFENDEATLKALLKTALEAAGHAVEAILDHELLFYDTQGAATVGLDGAFLASARLDNLLSCFCATEALLNSGNTPALIVLNDHEEVGSASSSGAAGPFLDQVLRRITPGEEDSARLRARAWLISADNAHAVHPNFPDRHDRAHGPRLGGGPVIKINANQRYASNSATQARFRNLCDQAAVPVQSFVTRSDLGCGSTIGPITAAELGIATVDVGIPQLAMHSIRELCAVDDVAAMVTALTQALSAEGA